jgi:hypothetical protein
MTGTGLKWSFRSAQKESCFRGRILLTSESITDSICYHFWSEFFWSLNNDMRNTTHKRTFPLAKIYRTRNLYLLLGNIYIYIYLYYLWGGTKSLGTAATSGLLYKPQMIDDDHCGAIGGMKIGRGNRSTRRKPAPAPLWPPQNPTCSDPGSNPSRRGGKPATNRLSYGAAIGEYKSMIHNKM